MLDALSGFGLPELVLDGVDCDSNLTALNVLRCVGQDLLVEHWRWLDTDGPRAPRAVSRTVGSPRHVSGEAFGQFWASSMPPESPLTVSLAISANTLRVNPPDGQPLNHWLDDRQGLLRSLVGSPPDDFHEYVQLQP